MSKHVKPKYRNLLHGKVHEAGFKKLTDFAKASHVPVSTISRVLSGWELPTPSMAEKMAAGLGMSLDEFNSLL